MFINEFISIIRKDLRGLSKRDKILALIIVFIPITIPAIYVFTFDTLVANETTSKILHKAANAEDPVSQIFFHQVRFHYYTCNFSCLPNQSE